MNTKYQELKNQIKANAELTRILKNHRKTVHIQGERLTNFKVKATYWKTVPKTTKEGLFKTTTVNERVKVTEEITIPVLEARMADSILNGYSMSFPDDSGKWVSYYIDNPSAANAHLFAIYGILRNERKTKKVKYWEEKYTSQPWYKGSALEDEVNSWRDEEIVCTDK